MDILNFTYDNNELSNHLYEVQDSGNANYGFKDSNTNSQDYWYDLNGNLTRDENKNVTSIEYNHLNLPDRIVVVGSEAGSLDLVYTANGKLLRKTKNDLVGSSVTDYAGNYIYENSLLRQFSHSQGYVEPDGSGGYDYIYNYLDHLGTVRLSYSDFNGDGIIDNTLELVQETNTYPFGLKHVGYNQVQNGTESSYQTYLGQELNKDLGLNWLVFRYRNYNPEIGRFFGSDPITEKFYYQSNYQFASNNPIWKVELEGLEGEHTTPGGTDLQDDSFVNGFKREAKAFGANLNKAATRFYANPPAALGEFAETTVNNLAQLAADIPNISGILGFENRTARSIEGGIQTARNFPSMSNERKGAITFGAAAFLVEAFVSKKLPVKSFADLPNSGTINPKAVRFSQDDIRAGFTDTSKGTIFDLTEGLKNGTINASEVKAIRLVEKDGKVFTLDNRRLKAFQDAGVDVPFETVDFNSLTKKDLRKFNTTTDGATIRIRGQQ